MDALQKQSLDDVFDAFSMISNGLIVNLMSVQGGVTRWSPSAVELFGLPGEYIENGAFDWTKYVHPEDRKRYLDVMLPLISGERKSYDLNYRVKTANGDYVKFRVIGAMLRGEDGSPGMIGGIMKNLGLADETDPITVLKSKAAYMRDLEQLIKKDRNIFTLLVGISKLSQINEVYGYTYGNRILQEVAWQIQETVSGRGSVYRTDDATFAFMTDTLSREEVCAIYDSIRLKLQRGVSVDGSRNSLTVNGGLIFTSGTSADPSSVYACLTYAYYESKQRMHGELVDFNGSINYDVRDSLDMVNVIRECILENCKGFSLRYQPVVSAVTEKTVAAETVLRWSSEKYGVVEPADFLPMLEKDFVFEELGIWILENALTSGKKFLEKDPKFVLGVNISSSQLDDELFIDFLLDTLKKTKFPAKNLCLELSERCRLFGMERLKSRVEALRAHGILVLLDDFGKGSNSIECLKFIPADYVKLDMNLVRGIDESSSDGEMLRLLCELAKVSGAKTCIKGVENEKIHDLVKQYGVSSLQGYYYSKPVTEEEFMALGI